MTNAVRVSEDLVREAKIFSDKRIGTGFWIKTEG